MPIMNTSYKLGDKPTVFLHHDGPWETRPFAVLRLGDLTLHADHAATGDEAVGRLEEFADSVLRACARLRAEDGIGSAGVPFEAA